jgi:hypothetical protein
MATTKEEKLEHKGYRIRSKRRDGVTYCRVFLAGHMVFKEEVDSVLEGLVMGRRWVDQRVAEIIASRGDDLPSAEEYAEAFRRIAHKLTEGYRAMLRAHYRATEHTLTTGQLAQAAGYADFKAANLHYGRIGVLLDSALHLALDTGPGGTRAYTTVLATSGDEEPHKGRLREEWRWVMRPQVVEAVATLGWV